MDTRLWPSSLFYILNNNCLSNCSWYLEQDKFLERWVTYRTQVMQPGLSEKYNLLSVFTVYLATILYTHFIKYIMFIASSCLYLLVSYKAQQGPTTVLKIARLILAPMNSPFLTTKQVLITSYISIMAFRSLQSDSVLSSWIDSRK